MSAVRRPAAEEGTYWVRVRDRVMVAHSLTGELFGPAQGRHGATFVVEVELRGNRLLPEGVLVDIGRARDLLATILAGLHLRDLDEHPEFRGRNSTSEVVARWIFDRLAAAIAAGHLGAGGEAITEVAVEIRESDVARAGFCASLRD